MANTICIMGESGSGKTTSLRNLDPSSTYIIDCDKKGLNWRGWRSMYNAERKNYASIDGNQQVLSYLMNINANAPHIKTVVVDTLNGIMVADERRRKDEKGYDKWSDLAWAVYDIVDFALKMRDDLTVVFTAHSQTDRDDNGVVFTRIKTSGKKLDKITLESKMRTVLHAKRIDGEYVFETRSDTSTAKDGMGGALPDVIPNDVREVIRAIDEFDNGGAADGDARD